MILLLSWLRGKRVGVILRGFDVGWHARVGVWRFVGRWWCVGLLQGRVCVSSRGV